MISPENIPPVPDPHTSGTKKPTTTNQRPPQQDQQQPQQPPLKCPRCDSSNTKFCYYNNYSLTQPRHFCKTCRRYWTKGGALRNVPIGGGCRKSKKLKPTTASATSAAGGATLFSGGAAVAPAVEFQLGGLSLPRLHPATAGVYTQFVTSTNGFGLDLMGTSGGPQGGDHHQYGGLPISLSSIESLSSINQEMHWKLQQQRLSSLIYGPPSSNHNNRDDNEDGSHDKDKEKHAHHQGEINLFHNLTAATTTTGMDIAVISNNRRLLEVGPTEWFFDSQNNITAATTTATTTVSNGCNNNNDNGEVETGVTWGAAHLHQFNGLQ